MTIPARARGLLLRTVLLTGVLAALTVFVNLPWFDEPLHPDLVELRSPEPASMQGNAFPLLYGLPAADGRDARAAGEAIVAALRERRRRGLRAALGDEELAGLLGGGSDLDAPWQARLESLECSSRASLDCAERLVADVRRAEIHPRLRLLLTRYDAMIRRPRFEETPAADIHSPVPAYRLATTLARVRLALSYARDPVAAFLAEAELDFEFWTTMLRDGRSLTAKMVALAGLRSNLEFLSALMRNRELDEDELGRMQNFLRPLTSEERDIGEAFMDELRLSLVSDKPLVVMLGEPSWLTRLTLQQHATLNEYYMTIVNPMRLRASLSAEEFHRRRGYERLTYDVRAFPPPLFNLGGKLVLRRAVALQGYIGRVHDLNGRISLVLLQAEIERNPGSSVEAVVRSSEHVNPYTLEPMKYDAQAHTLAFECLSNPSDVCAVSIGATPR